MWKIANVTLITTALLAGSATVQALSPLSGNTLRDAVAGRTLAYAGGITQRFDTQGGMSSNGLTGSWSVNGSRFCTQWATVGSQSCFTVARLSDGTGLKLTSTDGRAWTVTYR